MQTKREQHLYLRNALSLYKEFEDKEYCIEYLKSNVLYYTDVVQLFIKIISAKKCL